MTEPSTRLSTPRTIRDAHECETAVWLALRRALKELDRALHQVHAEAERRWLAARRYPNDPRWN